MAPDYIVERYKKKHGYYVMSHDESPADKRRMEGTWLAMWLSFVFTFFALALILVIRASDRDSRDVVVYLLTLPLLFACLFALIRAYAYLPLLQERREATEKYETFERRYTSFLAAIKVQSSEMHMLKDKEVSDMCEKLLSDLGKKVLDATREPPKRAHLTVELMDRYTAISEMGYGEKTIDKYITESAQQHEPVH